MQPSRALPRGCIASAILTAAQVLDQRLQKLVKGHGHVLFSSWDEGPGWRWLYSTVSRTTSSTVSSGTSRPEAVRSRTRVPSRVWFIAGYAFLSIAIVALLARHLRSRLAMIPESWLGKGQLLYLVFLWWMVIANLMKIVDKLQRGDGIDSDG